MNFVLMESFYQLDYGKPEIILWGRSISNQKKLEKHVIKGFRPYFYAPPNEEPYHDRITEYHDEIIKDALDRPVRKVYTKIPSDVPKVRDLFSFTDMADFLFDKRFLVDNHIRYAYNYTSGTVKPVEKEDLLTSRIVYFDIEVLSPEGIFPNPLDTDYPIVSIQTLDNYTNTIMVFTNGVPQTDDPTHVALTTEQDLYQTFMDYLKRVDPDIITGWSSSSYDLPYIIRRSWKLHVDISNLARHGTPRCEYDPETGLFNLRIIGRSTLDMLEAFKKITSARAQRESYGLKSIISDEDLLGDEAFEYDDLGPIMQKVFDGERWTEFIDYCKNDVIALEIIDRKMGLFTFFENLRKLTGCKLNDVLYNSKVIEMLLMHEGLTVMPTKKPYVSDDDDSFKGATVVDPVPGISEYVGTFDLASLYPNIMIAFQKSPDKDKLIVKTLEKTLALREDLRAQCKADPDNTNLENQQNAVKYINNSYYGVLGLKSFRLYDKEIASFITSTGRDLNQFLQQVAIDRSYTIIGGDTDAVFISPIKTADEGLSMENHFNDQLAKWSDDRQCKVKFKLKFEKLYRRILFKSDKKGEGVKKKYCGHLVWEEGHIKDELNYKGLELKRSDQSDITRDVLRYFLDQVLIQGNTQGALQYVKKQYKNIRNGTIDIHTISIPKAIRKVSYNTDNAWVRGIYTAKTEYNYVIQEGVKPRLIYLKRGEICIDEDFDISQIKDKIDYKKMADKVIKQKMESYIWSINQNWDHIIHNQQSLDNW